MTKTRRLREAEARLYQAWIANRRRADAILAELEELSTQAVGYALDHESTGGQTKQGG